MGLDVSARRAGDLEGVLERLASRRLTPLLALALLAFLAFVPGFASMPPMDRDEPRFAQASKQMLESGDWVDIRFQDEARLKKPVGIYWLQAAVVSAAEGLGVGDARTTIALYRLPSFVAAIGAVLLTWWTGLALFGRRAALVAGAMMAGCVLLGVEARLAKTDATLLLTVVAMIGALAHLRFAHAEDRPQRGFLLPLVFWSAAAASILDKGPVGPMVVGLALLAYVAVTRNWRWLARLRPILGLILVLLLVSPWFVAIMVKTSGDFLQKSVGNDMMSKVAGGQESHGAPPGSYLLAFWLTFWPFAPLAALAAPAVWRRRREPQIMFVLAWLIPSWLVFEGVPTKLPHYVLPLYPAIALLVAGIVDRGELALERWGRLVLVLVPVIAILLGVAGLAAAWIYEGRIAFGFLLFALVAAVAAILSWRAYQEQRAFEGIVLSLGAALCLYWGVYAVGMPAVPALWPSPRLAGAAQVLDCPNPAYATVGFREPSLVFLVGTDLAMEDGPGAADFLAHGPCRMAFVESRGEPGFLQRATALGFEPRLVTRVRGVNINGNKRLDIGVYKTR